MVYTTARITSVCTMAVRDFFPEGRRWKVRLHGKGDKLYDVWCHHRLEESLYAYVEAAGIAEETNAPSSARPAAHRAGSQSAGVTGGTCSGW